MTRRYLTASELRDLLEKQAGLCAHCFSEGPFEADHSTPNTWAPGKPDQLLCVPCHRAKTKRDIKAIAKVKRITGVTRSQWNGDRKSKPIQSRGFTQWRGMDGSIRRREQ